MNSQNNNKSGKKQQFIRTSAGKLSMVEITTRQALCQLPDLSTRRVISIGARSSTKVEIQLQPDLAYDSKGRRDEKGVLMPLCYKVSLETPIRLYELQQRREPKPAPVMEFEPIEQFETQPSSQTNVESSQDDQEDSAPVVPAVVMRHIKLPSVG
jgi:hypothetical protein